MIPAVFQQYGTDDGSTCSRSVTMEELLTADKEQLLDKQHMKQLISTHQAFSPDDRKAVTDLVFQDWHDAATRRAVQSLLQSRYCTDMSTDQLFEMVEQLKPHFNEAAEFKEHMLIMCKLLQYAEWDQPEVVGASRPTAADLWACTQKLAADKDLVEAWGFLDGCDLSAIPAFVYFEKLSSNKEMLQGWMHLHNYPLPPADLWQKFQELAADEVLLEGWNKLKHPQEPSLDDLGHKMIAAQVYADAMKTAREETAAVVAKAKEEGRKEALLEAAGVNKDGRSFIGFNDREGQVHMFEVTAITASNCPRHKVTPFGVNAMEVAVMAHKDGRIDYSGLNLPPGWQMPDRLPYTEGRGLRKGVVNLEDKPYTCPIVDLAFHCLLARIKTSASECKQAYKNASALHLKNKQEAQQQQQLEQEAKKQQQQEKKRLAREKKNKAKQKKKKQQQQQQQQELQQEEGVDEAGTRDAAAAAALLLLLSSVGL